MTKLASMSSKIVLVNFVIHLSIYLTYHSKKVFSQTVWRLQRQRLFLKEDDCADLSKYWQISVLPCFFKNFFERLMYNRLFKHLSNSKILYPKQFGFQKGHSTDHSLLQLVDQIYESFERRESTIRVFINLSKAFDTVDQNIVLKK